MSNPGFDCIDGISHMWGTKPRNRRKVFIRKDKKTILWMLQYHLDRLCVMSPQGAVYALASKDIVVTGDIECYSLTVMPP